MNVLPGTLQSYKENNSEWYTVPDGCSSPDVTSFVQGEILGFCCCGSPEENISLILEGLRIIDDKYPDGLSAEEYKEWWKEREKDVLENFGSDVSAYFFYYWADKEELTEHGGSVPGWLTSKGEKLLSLLSEWEELNKQEI